VREDRLPDPKKAATPPPPPPFSLPMAAAAYPPTLEVAGREAWRGRGIKIRGGGWGVSEKKKRPSLWSLAPTPV